MTETTKFWIKVIIYGLTKVHPAIKKMEAFEKSGEKQKEFNLATKTVQGWSEYCLQVAKCNLKVNGLEKIPTDRPVLFTPNHQSYADVPILLHALKDFDYGFLMRMQLNTFFAIEQISHILHCVPINQENAREGVKALNKTAEQIKNGFSMVVFPEGKRGFSNTPDEFKNGAFKIVQKTGVTVVPIYIRNAFKILEGAGGVITPTDVSVTVLDPIETSTMNREQVRELNEKVHNIILDESKKYKED